MARSLPTTIFRGVGRFISARVVPVAAPLQQLALVPWRLQTKARREPKLMSRSGSFSDDPFCSAWLKGDGGGLEGFKGNHEETMSYGQSLAKQYLGAIIGDDFLENHRPAWLEGMELDFFYPKHNLAFEFNGDQHYSPTSMGCPKAQKRRDARKRAICKGLGVKLISLTAADLLSTRIRMKVKNAHKCGLLPYYKMTDLDAECKRYRATLIRNYDSPSARRKSSKPWKAAMSKAWGKNQPTNQ